MFSVPIHIIAGDVEAPTTPINLVVTDQTTHFNITWSASTDNIGVTGYVLERRKGLAGLWELTLYTGLSRDYDDTPIENDTYYYRTKAFDDSDNFSAYSNIDSEVWTGS